MSTPKTTRPYLILCLLQQLHEVHPNRMKLPDLVVGANALGHPGETAASISSVLDDMEGAGFVEITRDSLDRSIKTYKRTEKGRVELVERGLA